MWNFSCKGQNGGNNGGIMMYNYGLDHRELYGKKIIVNNNFFGSLSILCLEQNILLACRNIRLYLTTSFVNTKLYVCVKKIVVFSNDHLLVYIVLFKNINPKRHN